MPSHALTEILESFRQLVRDVGGADPEHFDYLAHRKMADADGAEIYTAHMPAGVRAQSAGFPIGAEWLIPDGADASSAILYLPGGGYYSHPMSIYRPLAARLAAAAGMPALLCAYRLAPEHPFPAAVEDAVACYEALLGDGPRRSIAICGDSAGGGLALATLIALRRKGLPMPAAAAVMSPWTDLALTGQSMISNLTRDPVGQASHGFRHAAALYLQGHSPEDPLASPLYADLAGLPPLFIQVGDVELLRDDAVRFAEKARAAGVDVRIDVWPDVPHVWHLYAGRLPEGRQGIADLAAFLKSAMALKG